MNNTVEAKYWHKVYTDFKTIATFIVVLDSLLDGKAIPFKTQVDVVGKARDVKAGIMDEKSTIVFFTVNRFAIRRTFTSMVETLISMKRRVPDDIKAGYDLFNMYTAALTLLDMKAAKA